MQTLSPREEAALTRRVVRGDPQALDRFHDYLCDPLYRFVHYRLGGTRAEVEEVVQDSFLAALQSLHRYRGDSSLFTWMCGIAKNRISRLRRRRARERVADTLEGMDPEIEQALLDLSREELPQEALEREETQEMVGATLAQLPPDYQQILTAKYVEALSVKEIARRDGRSPKAVESTLTRARGAFRRVFEILARGMGGEVGRA